VRHWLQRHDASALLDAAELVVSELVGNVVLHVGGTVEVRIAAADGEVVLEVVDTSAVVPHTRLFSQTSSTGRGMRLVHSLTAAHGVRPGGGGKTVWALLTTDGAGRSEEELSAEFGDVERLVEAEARADRDGVALHVTGRRGQHRAAA
jgi:hypothetical protein